LLALQNPMPGTLHALTSGGGWDELPILHPATADATQAHSTVIIKSVRQTLRLRSAGNKKMRLGWAKRAATRPVGASSSQLNSSTFLPARPPPCWLLAAGCWRVRPGQTNPLWTKITPGIAGLAAGLHARRPEFNEIREFRKTMPRPRRGSELVFSFQRPAGCEKQLQMPPHTHHHMRSAWQSHVCIVFGVVTSPEAYCGATWRPRHPSCTKHKAVRVSTTGHHGSQYIFCTETGHITTVS
jgi:hypothetical protein